MPESSVVAGYLVLADISGYTAFLTGSELEHANGIVEDLTRCVVDGLAAPMRVVKLEGDAVFAYGLADSFSDAERVLEIVERTYIGFVDRLFDIERQTTCPCAACSNVRGLDLKFVVHFGEFVRSRVGDHDDVTGPAVIVVHRLLKNDIVSTLAVSAYAFITDAVLARMAHRPELPVHTETIEHVGDVGGMVEDLHGVAAADRERRHVVVSADDAEIETALVLPVPRAVAWDWWTNPKLTIRFQRGVTSTYDEPNDAGRTGEGATLHCAHGSAAWSHRMLDWKPFDYYTQQVEPDKRSLKAPPPSLMTFEFSDRDDGGTALTVRCKLSQPSIGMRLMKPMLRRMFATQFQVSAERFRALVDAGEVPTG